MEVKTSSQGCDSLSGKLPQRRNSRAVTPEKEEAQRDTAFIQAKTAKLI